MNTNNLDIRSKFISMLINQIQKNEDESLLNIINSVYHHGLFDKNYYWKGIHLL